jgi:hypothetical protein
LIFALQGLHRAAVQSDGQDISGSREAFESRAGQVARRAGFEKPRLQRSKPT